MHCIYENKPCDRTRCPHAPEKFFTEGKTDDLCQCLSRWTEAGKKRAADSKVNLIDLTKCNFRQQPRRCPYEKPKAETVKPKKKKVTQRDFVQAALAGRVLSTEELAKEYLAAGHGKKNASIGTTKTCFAVTICNLRKDGVPIERVSRGFYTLPA